MRTIAGWTTAAVLMVASSAFAGNPCCCAVGTAVAVAPGQPVQVAQAGQGYRSFSYEPSAANVAQVPQGGAMYRSYSYEPAAAPVYRSTSTLNRRHYSTSHPVFMNGAYKSLGKSP